MLCLCHLPEDSFLGRKCKDLEKLKIFFGTVLEAFKSFLGMESFKHIPLSNLFFFLHGNIIFSLIFTPLYLLCIVQRTS